MRHPELWARLSAYSFDTGTGSAPYSVKLARAEGWSATFTARVIEEYRQFLYLTQVSDRQVTPSQIVDAAWHMHLTFTRDYWEDLCPNVIGAPVHHQPCAGDEEMPRYRDQFGATKALYEAEFGHEPPLEIWGRDKTRRVKALAMSELGAGMTSPVGIAFMPFVISLVLLILEPTPLIAAITVLTGIMFLLVVMSARGRRRKKRRRSRARDDEVWIDDDGPSGGSRGGAGRSVGSKRSRDSDDDDRTTGTVGGTAAGGGFLAGFFSGGGDDDGGDSGGCGGCGD